MPQKHSQGRSKRELRDEAGARLRAVFGVDPENPFRKQVSADELLAEAFELASEITEFATTYLRHFMIDPVTEQVIEPAQFHKDLYQILLSEQYAAIAAPREHAKSTVVSVIFVLYCICYKRRRYIILISDTQPQASQQLAAVKAELESNDELRSKFGDLVGEKKWDVSEIRTSTDISIVSRGAGQSLRGLRYRMWRPDLVICDDLENEQDVDNPDSRAKLVRWFLGTVMNLGKYCQVFVIGTILHYDSFLSELLDADKHKSFTKRRYMAVDIEWTPESVLWPAKWDIEALRKKERDIGSVFFNQEWRNLPISDETQVFREEWITRHQYWREYHAHEPLVRVTYYDPAISEKRKADFFASVTVGIRENGQILVLRAEQAKMPFLKQVEFIVGKWDEERPEVVGIEDQAYQMALRQAVEALSTASGRYMNVVGVPHLTDKFMRIASMSSLVESGAVRFCLDGTQKALISQLLFLGKIKDDLADALESAVQLARAMNFKPVMASVSNAGVGERAPGQGRGMLTQLFLDQAAKERDVMLERPQEYIQRGRKSLWH
jgi:predicted phage terminase large subunit-like protein